MREPLSFDKPAQAAVIGAGPAGLAAAEVMSVAGVAVTIYERMPSPARKFLMAGRGGLNLTHSEPLEAFLKKYGSARGHLAPAIRDFPPDALRAWCEDLGVDTFVGSSGRVFPAAMKASPLLRAWLARLAERGVVLRTRWRWRGWNAEGALVFDTPNGAVRETPDTAILALGGASWPRLGSDGSWTGELAKRDVAVAPLRPANCGFFAGWSDIFRSRFAGQPLKPAIFTHLGQSVRGEAMITDNGIEGGAVYALSAAIRDAITKDGRTQLQLDLAPGMSSETISARLDAARGQSIANRLRRAGLTPLAASLLREGGGGPTLPDSAAAIAARIKCLPLNLLAPFDLSRAISTAGGVSWNSIASDYSLHAAPNVFVCGEMLDWEAPTGGYLLQACVATGRAAGLGVLRRMAG